MKALPADVLGGRPGLFLRSNSSSSMKVMLTPAAAKGYSHSERDPFVLCNSVWNSWGSLCIKTTVQKIDGDTAEVGKHSCSVTELPKIMKLLRGVACKYHIHY